VASIKQIIKGLFPSGAVPSEIGIDLAEALRQRANEQLQLAESESAARRAELEAAVAISVLAPEDSPAAKVARIARERFREAEEAILDAKALVGGAEQKLAAARGREERADAEAHLAEVRSYAEIAGNAAVKIDTALEFIAQQLGERLIPSLGKLVELEPATIRDLPTMQRHGLANVLRWRIELALGMHQTGLGTLTYGQLMKACDLEARVDDVCTLAIASARDAVPQAESVSTEVAT
jgi:hypothetical protein